MNYRSKPTRKSFDNSRNIQWHSTLCIDMEDKSDDDNILTMEYNQPETSYSDDDNVIKDVNKTTNEIESQSLCFLSNFSGNSQNQNFRVAENQPRSFFNCQETASLSSFQSLSRQKSRGHRISRPQSRRVRGRRGNASNRGNFSQNMRWTERAKSSSSGCSNYTTPELDSRFSNLSINDHKKSTAYGLEYFPNSVNINQKKNQTSMRLDKKLFDESMDNETNTDVHNSQLKVNMWRKAKEEFYSFKDIISPSEIIMDYRLQIQNISDECTVQNLTRREAVTDLMDKEKTFAPIFKLHYDNLILQQKQFDAYVSAMMHECSVVHDNNLDDIIKKADNIKMHIENESSLFQRTLPAYAYKQDILCALEKHQVILVSSDCSYFFNVVLPIIIINELSNYFVVSCESSKISCDWVKEEIESIMKHVQNCLKYNSMNEDQMLDYLNNDISSENNFIIFNLPLKRSITADLLLASLRDLLIKQTHSRLILLLSVFDNITKFQKYFSDIEVFSLEVPKLLLPVQTVWKREPLSISSNYKEDIVSTAMSVHILNEPGDVCAFLPSLSDAKAAIAMFTKRIKELNYDNVECILLHKNSNISQLKHQLSLEKRKIFFTTNCAEVIPFQTVRYVIDSGLTRDYIFNSDRKLDVLTTVFNSRATARLRKSLVCVFVSGICYRIYNKENFCSDMSSYEIPDILTLNPFNTFITIFHHQPENALSVQFIEPLSDVVKNNTVKLLKNFNAVKNGKLTPLGKKMAKLPFYARYSKLILQSIQWGFPYEAVILVAFFSIDSYVFKYAKDEENQRVIDASKLELIQHESDALTFLYIFKCWMENKCSEFWCNKHHIEFDTLNEIKSKVDEICNIVYDCLNETILQEFSEVEDSALNILEMLFQCFADNLCVYTGHYRCGYRILSSRQTAFLHPSSVFCNKGNLPQLIIFNKIIHTSRNFLFGITAIPSDLVLNSLTDKTLEYDYSDIFERSLASGVIEPVSERIIKQVLLGKKGKKLQEIEDLMKKELKSELIIVDPSAEKGCVYVYALKAVLDSAIAMVDKILKSNLDDVINAEQVHMLELRKGEIVVPLEIKYVMGAKITSVKIKDTSEKCVSTQGSKPIVTKPVKDRFSSVQYSINLTWIRRPCNGICYVSFTKSNFLHARRLAFRNFRILQSEVCVEVSSKEDYQLILSDVPREAKASDVEEALKTYLPSIPINKIELKFVKSFETTLKDIEEIKLKIQENCEDYTDLLDFEIVIPKPKNTATIMTAFINVFGAEDLTSASESLSNTIIQNFKVNAIPVYRCVIKTTFKIYEALGSCFQKEIDKLKLELSKMYPNIDLFRFEAQKVVNQDLVLIKLLSNNIEVMKHLQKRVNEMLEGEVLTKNLVSDINKLFCHGGHMWLRTLEKSKKVYIIEEYNSKIIRVYGSQENCFHVKESILKFLEDTENEAVETIILSNDKNSRILLKSIIKEYGVNLESFVELCSLRSAILDIKLCRLFLHGSRESIDYAKEILNMLSSKLDSTEEYSFLSGGEMCPVCACPAFNLTFRLQHCGHLYCNECILFLVEQAKFPIQCSAENCSEDVVLDDIIRILDEDEEKIKKLLHTSLNDFLEKNRSEIFYCPAPDCPMFAYKREISGKWMCPLCQNDICTNCNVVYHYGFTCELYQGSKKDPDYSFKVWKTSTTQCKECPKCKMAIEKNAGCDHMICSSCKAHFCWVCVREFPTAQAVYNHIPFCDQHPKW